MPHGNGRDQEFFLKGKVVDHQGFPVDQVTVSVVDKDLVSDDSLGTAQTDETGRFQLSFTRRDFNQEPFEHEENPDLFLTFYLDFNLKPVLIDKRPLGVVDFSMGILDLGSIVIPDWSEKLLQPQEHILKK